MFRKFISRTTLLTTLLVLSFSGNILAEKTYSMDGSISSKDSNEVMPLSESLIVIHTSNEGTISTNDAENPMNNSTGKCFGSAMLENGNMSGTGHCTYTDSDGDKILITWNAITGTLILK